MSASYRVLILGFPLGDLPDAGNAHSTALAAFAENADQVIATIPPERLAEVRDRVAKMPEIRIDAVHLAPEGLSTLTPSDVETTLETLHEQGLVPFGVGRNLTDAMTPHSVEIPAASGGGQLNFYGSHIRPEGSSNNSAPMADEDHAGFAPLSTQEVPRPRLETERLDAFHIAMPSWRKKSAWRNTAQYALAHQMLNKDFDLVLGTGTQRLQEVHRKRERWVVYGLGDSPSAAQNQLGHSSTGAEEPPPFALWAMFEVHGVDRSRRVTLKLYPVENSGEGTGTRPVSAEDFETIVSALAERPLRPWRFRNSAMTAGSDDLGHHLALDLGAWPTGQRPSRLEDLTPAGDPNESPRLTPSAELEDAATRINRPPGPMILPLGAEAKGAKVHWLADSTSVITFRGKRFLTNGPTAHESDLGSTIVGDKALAAELLRTHGVSTPRTVVVRSAEEAVEAARTIAGPVVIKPQDGSKGRGVSTDLVLERDIRRAFTFARKYRDGVIVQEHIEVGEEMRVMASPDLVVAANVRVFPHVVGDGVSTIEQLIKDKNLQRASSTIFGQAPIPIDRITRQFLRRHELSVQSVPPLGETVTVRNVGGHSVGADIKQDIDNASQDVKDTARQAIAAIPGLAWGGVDIITEVKTGKAYVIEVNTNAGFLSAAFPTYGQPKDVTQEIFQLRYDDTSTEPARDAPVRLPAAASRPQALVLTHGLRTQQSSAVGELIHRAWGKQGLSVERLTDKLSEVTTHGGERLWVTAEGRTSADRYVVRRVVRRHPLIFRFLEQEAVPMVRGRTVSSTERLRSFVEGRIKQVVMLPVRKSWDANGMLHLTDQEALELSALPFERTWVQSRPQGRYFRVLATPHEVSLITEKSPRGPLKSNEIDQIGRVAVSAVRAVPELRWAAVDLIFRRRRLVTGLPDPVLVEGMTLTPRYSADDHVLAGDFDKFSLSIIL